ncbi:hypothetical protein SAMN05443551_1396 [Marivita hallyeonensis]|uniref:Uncharacterized protein n=1 Tax=Marivita hallyeonensis TaxID=996342 RepID=A0A1M5QKJ0_9RHOB|nr:hypothetical protein SAMN05443551_1396 [Marivita hallyeonensis]
MPARLWNIFMVLLIGPFAYLVWKPVGAKPGEPPSKAGAEC